MEHFIERLLSTEVENLNKEFKTLDNVDGSIVTMGEMEILWIIIQKIMQIYYKYFYNQSKRKESGELTITHFICKY